jgi:hypothetical protein
MRRNEQMPFRQCADIFRTDRFISIEPLSGCSVVRPEDKSHVVYLAPEASDDVLGRALLERLDLSRFFWPHDDPAFFEPDKITRSYQNWQDDMMRRYDYKTKREAYRTMDWCRAKRTEGKIFIDPHKREKPEFFRDLPPDKDVSIPETRDAAVVGAALRLALERCE